MLPQGYIDTLVIESSKSSLTSRPGLSNSEWTPKLTHHRMESERKDAENAKRSPLCTKTPGTLEKATYSKTIK